MKYSKRIIVALLLVVLAGQAYALFQQDKNTKRLESELSSVKEGANKKPSSNVLPPSESIPVNAGYSDYFWKTETVEKSDTRTVFDAWCIYEYPDLRTEKKLLGRYTLHGKLPEFGFTTDTCARI